MNVCLSIVCNSVARLIYLSLFTFLSTQLLDVSSLKDLVWCMSKPMLIGLEYRSTGTQIRMKSLTWYDKAKRRTRYIRVHQNAYKVKYTRNKCEQQLCTLKKIFRKIAPILLHSERKIEKLPKE